MTFEGFCTERLRLRPFAIADLEAFTAYRNDPEVAKYQSWESYSIEQAHSLYAGSCHDFNVADSWYQLAIADIDSDALLGDCAINFKDDGEQVEIGFTLARENQHRGYAREAVGALVKYLFLVLKKRRVTATVDVLNAGSIGLLEHLKFRREAHFVENIFFKGSWGSEYCYGLLASEVEGVSVT